jgi:hypothetical protein
MKRFKIAALSIAILTNISPTKAQEKVEAVIIAPTSTNIKKTVPIKKFYFGNSLDGAILSTALIDKAGSNSLGTLRAGGFFHIGFTYNYNFSKNQGFYTGLDLKNIGFIEKYSLSDITMKKRTYTLGVPLGFRLGNMTKRSYFFLGAGVDIAFHYKAKYWSNVQSKIKYNDWFSKETEILQPYLFAGFAVKGTTFKVQYYTNNFLNQDYTAYDINAQLVKPYANTKVNLLLFSLGRDMNFRKLKKAKK